MRDPRRLRQRAGTQGDQHQDQYFLEDERVLGRIIETAEQAAFDFDHVLEIGPGTGALTAHLLARSEFLTVIERDRSLAKFLRNEFRPEINAGKMEVCEGDALEVSLPAFTSSISNLPYSLSSELLFRLLPMQRPLLVLVQREFAERMAAAPGTSEYGRLSVTAQHYGNISIAEIVPPSVFEPSPPVESALVVILPDTPSYDLLSEECFFSLVTAIFTQRRKTLRNAIRNTTHISGITDPAPVIASLDDDLLSRRPGTLSPETFAMIANTVIWGELWEEKP